MEGNNRENELPEDKRNNLLKSVIESAEIKMNNLNLKDSSTTTSFHSKPIVKRKLIRSKSSIANTTKFSSKDYYFHLKNNFIKQSDVLVNNLTDLFIKMRSINFDFLEIQASRMEKRLEAFTSYNPYIYGKYCSYSGILMEKKLNLF